MKREPSLSVVVGLGFAAVIATLIGCTFVLDRTLQKIYRTSGNDDVVSAIEEEARKTRDLISGARPSTPDPVLPWIIPNK
ncbi:hypothetical protein FBY06_11568 [Pseudomonas sp. SJZ085]|nr:hypothetical protein FBX99_11568 [Pseudomonas sp. SJZ074]TWC36115.1 hypothetical protein FBY06_11568 [Pseudomonas sp. SJZ085]